MALVPRELVALIPRDFSVDAQLIMPLVLSLCSCSRGSSLTVYMQPGGVLYLCTTVSQTTILFLGLDISDD